MGTWSVAVRRRLLVLLCLGLVGALAIGAYTRWWLARPIGSGPAGPAVDKTAFEQTWSERPVLLLGLGDSVTAGLGADRRDHSYFERLLKESQAVDPENLLHSTFMTGDVGKLYLLLCRATGRDPFGD